MTTTDETTSPADTTPTTSSTILVVDAPDNVQEWLDRFNALPNRPTGGDRHPHSQRTIVITLSQLWRAVEAGTKAHNNIDQWSIATSGLPPIPLPPNPGGGNIWHNIWHAAGGQH